jgi:hypothetical protein
MIFKLFTQRVKGGSLNKMHRIFKRRIKKNEKTRGMKSGS